MKSRTIGEVLQELKGEFDDITISKIRFLEAEGLISPDRTSSGYRTFAATDIDRLRYVLRAQRDRYLPLRVIRDELDRIDGGLPVGEPTATPPVDDLAALVTDHDAAVDGAGEAAARQPVAAPSLFDDADEPATTLSLRELADTTGLEPRDVESLCDHGILEGEHAFDAEDVQAARAAAELLDNGLEARHLRMYRQFADRELALYEQLVSALLRQKNPDSRRTATAQVERLVRSGGGLHRILLTRRLRSLLRS